MAKAAAFLGLSWLAQYACAKDVRHSWNITWVNAAPNGHERPVIGINNQWPCPQLDVDLGDRLIVEVYNGLGDQSTGIHWHGFNQYMTGTMDGSVGTTQCGIEPGSKITYDFVVNQTGTYWYHSHEMGQYPDGLRGALNVHDPSPPFHYDAEFTLTLSDWYNDQMINLLQYYQSEENLRDNGGDEPLPDSALINDRTGPKIKVEPNKTYLVRIVCLGNWPGHTFVFDDHEMTVVEVDGIYTEPYDVTDKKLRITTGQRTSVLIHTKSDVSRNYAFWDTMDINMMFLYENRSVPETFNPNATAWLVYDETKELPPPPDIHSLDPNADFIDDVSFVPEDGERLLEPVDRQLILHTSSKEINGVQRFTVNGETYLPQDVPSLYTAMTSENSSDPAVYGQVNPIVVHHGEIVEIVINNHHANLHPWHLHGHQFQVLQRSAVDGGSFHGYFRNVSSTPIKRDTIMVQNNGHVVIRFRADNPGVWLLHCHIEWHVVSGLTATLIEAPESINYTLPQDHRQLCSSYGIPTSGNAAGNSGHDLSGANTEVTPSNGAASSKSPGSSSSSAIVVPSSSSRPTSSSARPIYSSIRPIGHSSTPSQTSSSLVTPKPQSTHSPTSTPTTSQTSSSLITPKLNSSHSPTFTPTPSPTPTPTPKPEATPEVTSEPELEDDSSSVDGYEDEGYVVPEYTGPPDGPTTVAALGDYNFVWVEGRKGPGHVSIAHAPKATSSQR